MEGVAKEFYKCFKNGVTRGNWCRIEVGHSVQIRGRLNARLSKTLDSANSGSGKGGGYRFSNYAEKGGTTDSGASSFGFATIHNSFITFVLYGGLLKSYYDLSPGGAVRPYAMN